MNMQLATHHCVCCMCTWCQCVLHAERRCSSEVVDHAASVSAHALHSGGQVAKLRLQLVQQRRMHVEQHVGFNVTQLQRTQPLIKGCVQTNAFFNL